MASRDIYERTVDEDVQQNRHNTCPECSGRVTTNDRETVCDDCGLVLRENRLDRGPDWRGFDDDETTARRAGMPNTVARHDRGIGSTIGRKRDGYGQMLDSATRRHLSRLRRRNSRAQVGSKSNRNQIAGFTEIRRMVGAFGLAESVRDQACQLFRTAQDENLIQGRSIEAMASACLYAVCRINEHPRTFADVAAVSRVGEERIRTSFKALNRELELPIPPACPIQYLSQIASAVEASQGTERRARDILQAAPAHTVANGQNPAGAAAGAVYCASQRTSEWITQEALADAADVSRVTVRKRYQELAAAAD